MQVAVEHLWGTSSSDMYFVGLNGSIVHYDGSSFEQMDSGTDTDLKNIAGSPDGEHVFAVGYEISGEHVNQSIVIELNQISWQIVYSSDHTFPSDSTYGMASAVSVKGEVAYITSRAGILKYNYFTKDISLMQTTPFSLYYSHVVSMSIMNQNDIFLLRGSFRLLHYNGNSWALDEYIYNYFSGDTWSYNLDTWNNMVAIVGDHGYNTAIVARGYR
ncbi:MAG: hypothetical protein GXO91_00160 [FCB group bacterium]|nr:hypothetical protein [FCB group bacterium]